jgi:hypothetical protein
MTEQSGYEIEYKETSLEEVRSILSEDYKPLLSAKAPYMPDMVWKETPQEWEYVGNARAKVGVGFTEDDEVIFFEPGHMVVGEIPPMTRDRPWKPWVSPQYEEMCAWVPKVVSLEKPIMFLYAIGMGFDGKGTPIRIQNRRFTLGGMEFRFENSDVESIYIAE